MVERPRYKDISFTGIGELKDYAFKSRDDKDGVEKAETGIKGLGKVNVFVGRNNSGKSRFMRALMKTPKFEFNTSIHGAELYHAKAENMQVTLDSVRNNANLGPYSATTFSNLTSGIEYAFGHDRAAAMAVALQSIMDQAAQFPRSQSHATTRQIFSMIDNRMTPALQQAVEYFQSLPGTPVIGNEHKTYIPILRGLRVLRSEADLYEEATSTHYGIEPKHATIISGQDMFKQLQGLKNGDKSERQRIEDYETFLSKTFFDDETVELVPFQGKTAEKQSGVVHVNVGTNKEDRPIYHLGDGIQAIIALTFCAFIATKRTLFFIEEPELHLHPGLQRRLIELFLEHPRFAEHQFFMTTHSNHMIEMTIDYPECAAFLFRRTKDRDHFTITRVSEHEKMVLHELGARATSMFLTHE